MHRSQKVRDALFGHAVGGEDNDGRVRGLQCSVQIGEALGVEHVHLVDEQHARHQFGRALQIDGCVKCENESMKKATFIGQVSYPII